MGNKTYNAKSLHHGTILLDVNMENMQRYLNPNKLKLISKGVDSVRARVLNLKDKFPTLNKDIVFEAIQKEFMSYHNITNSNRIYLDDENTTKNANIKELFNYYNSWNWKFGNCPDFTNSLSHKFDWGLVDLSLKVENGIIQESKFYSDTLVTEFIDMANGILAKENAKFTYDAKGVDQLLNCLGSENEQYNGYVKDMKEVLLKQI
jgi:lipoate-protein ligase A